MTAAGSESAFEAIVHRYRRVLHAYCRRLLLSESHSEDVVQQTFLSAWASLQTGGEVRELKAWLYRIAHNHAITVLRRARDDFDELNESLRGADAPEFDLERRMLMLETLAAVAALPELQREAIVRTAIDGSSYEEVAAALGVSNNAVRGLVYRARNSLRAALTAIAPQPLVMWVAGVTRRDGALGQWMSALCAGGGSGAETAVVTKGARVIATTAVLVGGAVGGVLTASSSRNRSRGADVAPQTEAVRGPGPSDGWSSSRGGSTSGPRRLPVAAGSPRVVALEVRPERPLAIPSAPEHTVRTWTTGRNGDPTETSQISTPSPGPTGPTLRSVTTEGLPLNSLAEITAPSSTPSTTRPSSGAAASHYPSAAASSQKPKFFRDVHRASTARAPMTTGRSQDPPQLQTPQDRSGTSWEPNAPLAASDQPPSGAVEGYMPTARQKPTTSSAIATTNATVGWSDPIPQRDSNEPLSGRPTAAAPRSMSTDTGAADNTPMWNGSPSPDDHGSYQHARSAAASASSSATNVLIASRATKPINNVSPLQR